MAKEHSQLRERQRTDLREPQRYKVIIYNDDFTTMEFVVTVLVQVFPDAVLQLEGATGLEQCCTEVLVVCHDH